MVDQQKLEQIAEDLVQQYEIHGPPVPIESMLQRPPRDMVDDPEQLNISRLSTSFISVGELYAPRMSLARLLAREIVSSDWGAEQGLPELAGNEEGVHAFARTIMMPASLIHPLSESALTAEYISVHFEVPADDALLRLNELGLLKKRK